MPLAQITHATIRLHTDPRRHVDVVVEGLTSLGAPGAIFGRYSHPDMQALLQRASHITIDSPTTGVLPARTAPADPYPVSLQPTSTKLSRKVERFCANVLKAICGGIVLSVACFAVGFLTLAGV